jgi:hypothetical protein
MKDIYLHCTQGPKGTSDKVYSIHLRQTDANRFVLMGWHGGRGTNLKTRGAFKLFTDIGAARSAMDALYNQKRGHGYNLSDEATVWPNGIHWLIDWQIVPDAEVQRIANNEPAAANPPYAKPTSANRKPRSTYTPPPQPPPHTPQPPPPPRAAPPPPNPAPNAPMIPPWILACFHSLPAPQRPQAVDILSKFFPNEAPLIAAGSKRPEATGVDWMRAVFLRTLPDQRSKLFRLMTLVVHEDYSHDHQLNRNWNTTYSRFKSP